VVRPPQNRSLEIGTKKMRLGNLISVTVVVNEGIGHPLKELAALLTFSAKVFFFFFSRW